MVFVIQKFMMLEYRCSKPIDAINIDGYFRINLQASNGEFALLYDFVVKIKNDYCKLELRKYFHVDKLEQ
jgi:hypothetical protein